MSKKHKLTLNEPITTYSHEFWENYSLFLLKQSISKKYITWYVLRTKQYIAAFPDQHIRTHSAKNVEEYLNKIGHDTFLKPWQFGQVVDAIRILFCLALKKSWAHDCSNSPKRYRPDYSTKTLGI